MAGVAVRDTCWPGERIQAEAGAHQVHVTLATLRKLGLGAHLVRSEDGYQLTGMIVVELIEP